MSFSMTVERDLEGGRQLSARWSEVYVFSAPSQTPSVLVRIGMNSRSGWHLKDIQYAQ